VVRMSIVTGYAASRMTTESNCAPACHRELTHAYKG
jgi:hypothetical protein